MVKLLRLTSEDNCNFNVNMDSDLIVGENAQIAVKNLTFQDNFETLTTNRSQLAVTYESQRGPSVSELPTKTYTLSTVGEFFTDMDVGMNKTLKVVLNSQGPTAAAQGFCGQYQIDRGDFRSIKFRLSPVICPVVTHFLQTPDPNDFSINKNLMTINQTAAGTDTLYVAYDETVPVNDLEAVDMCLIYQVLGGAATNLRTNFISPRNPSVRWCQGSALLSCRIQDLQTNGGAADTNGFEIGLTTTPSFGFRGETILDSKVMFSIRVQRPTDDYKFIVPDATTFEPVSPLAYSTATGIAPSTPSTNPAENDVLIISREMNHVTNKLRIVGRIYRNGLVAREIFQYIIPDGKEEVSLFPYICMFGSGTDAVAGQLSAAFDPWKIEEYRDDAYFSLLHPEFGNKFCGVSCFDTVGLTIPGGGYINLTTGNDWTQNPGGAIERFDTLDLGFVATYRRTQVGTALVQWWEAVGATNWNLYNTKPVVGQAPDNTATIVPATGVITIGASTFTPTALPTVAPAIPDIGESGLPALDERWYSGQLGLTANSNADIPVNILEFMGFDETGGDGGIRGIPFIINTTSVPYGYNLVPEGVFQTSISDNYVVVIDSQKVVSYDCSETNESNSDVVGRRANILATIPANNNDGLLEFSENEVQYIDMDNQGSKSITNLRLRVLDKSLQSINTTGMSVMTLLIKDN